MTRALGLALLAVGIVLIIWGINASDSFASDVSRFFTGQPTDKSMWLTLGGIAAAIFGTVVSLLRGSPKS
jgi:ABC-type phosphate transport system permease subunit